MHISKLKRLFSYLILFQICAHLVKQLLLFPSSQIHCLHFYIQTNVTLLKEVLILLHPKADIRSGLISAFGWLIVTPFNPQHLATGFSSPMFVDISLQPEACRSWCHKQKHKQQWLWLCLQSGRFHCQMSGVWTKSWIQRFTDKKLSRLSVWDLVRDVHEVSWNKALWLAVTSHVTPFNQSQCFISA